MPERNANLWWLLSGLGVAIALWWYSRTQSGGEVVSEAVGAVAGAVTSTIRGIRNNNPGNIVISKTAWQGKLSPNTDGTFEQFDTMENGIRALAITLKNYQRLHGLNTVRGIITRWSATDQDAYVANVASALGVDPDDSIDTSDPDTLAVIVQGIIRQENGFAGALLVSTDTLQQGISLA